MEGALVIFCFRTEDDSVRSLADEVEQHGGKRPVPFRADVTAADDRKALIDWAVEHGGGLDILVNNAGTRKDGIALGMKEQWDTILDVNLTAPFRLSQLAVRQMMRRGYGRLINIGSIASRLGSPGQVNYTASKAGLEGMSRSMAQEYGRKGVTVNTVNPGYLETELTAEGADYARDYVEAYSALGKFPTVDSVANVIAFLASEEAWALTGQTINVDAGMVKT
jgi:3-oxoacyl-[acyl-carrier protein] reductase